MSDEQLSPTDILAWLQETHPDLHVTAEVDRDWVWLAVDLRGDHNKPVRESIKAAGFRFHKRGGHLLPSGKLGMWGHSCNHPIRFWRGSRPKQATEPSISDKAILAMFG